MIAIDVLLICIDLSWFCVDLYGFLLISHWCSIHLYWLLWICCWFVLHSIDSVLISIDFVLICIKCILISFWFFWFVLILLIFVDLVDICWYSTCRSFRSTYVILHALWHPFYYKSNRNNDKIAAGGGIHFSPFTFVVFCKTKLLFYCGFPVKVKGKSKKCTSRLATSTVTKGFRNDPYIYIWYIYIYIYGRTNGRTKGPGPQNQHQNDRSQYKWIEHQCEINRNPYKSTQNQLKSIQIKRTSIAINKT